MHSFLRGAIVLSAVCATLPATMWGQQAEEAPATGSVSGTITAGDTQRPARFAKVTLTPVAPPKPDLTGFSNKDVEKDPGAAMLALGDLMKSVTMLQTQTALDGSYTITNVAPGDYYLSPVAPGYVSPLAAAQEANSGSAAGSSKRLSDVPVVHVEANRTVRGDATMQRGAAISGTVRFDDGSAAPGVIVTLEDPRDKAKAKGPLGKDDVDMAAMGQAMTLAMSGGLIVATTDDRGRFRVAGLATGEYAVKTTLTVRGGMSIRGGVMDVASAASAAPLVYYAPGTVHKKDAAVINVKAGDERGDIEVRIDMAGLHSVTGHVASAVDHHNLNSGRVTLTDTADKKVTRSAAVDATGAFDVAYVPPGSYTLKVSGGADTEALKNKSGGIMRFASKKTLKSYDDLSEPVMVGENDVKGINVELKESSKVQKDVDINQVLGGLAGGSPKE